MKRLIFNFIMHPTQTRPQWWIRLFQFVYLKRGKGSVIYRSVRKDLPPFRTFSLGRYSVVEDFCCLNNAVGDLTIGHHSRIGLGSTVIGPVALGDNVHIAQNVVLSGLNHNFEAIDVTIDQQGVSTLPIVVENDVWIGANSTILAGVRIGKHSVVAAGSVVNRDVPPYSVCAGVPARVVKQYDFESRTWQKVPVN